MRLEESPPHVADPESITTMAWLAQTRVPGVSLNKFLGTTPAPPGLSGVTVPQQLFGFARNPGSPGYRCLLQIPDGSIFGKSGSCSRRTTT